MFRKLNLALALMVAFGCVSLLPVLGSAQTYYSTTTGTLGDQNSNKDYRITTTQDGVVHFAQDTGVTFPFITASTNQTLTAAQTGTTMVFNNGVGAAKDNTTFTLPSAVVGLSYTVIGDVAHSFRLKPASGEIINYSTDIANSKVKNTSAAAGDSITVFCATIAQWSIKDKSGTWATDNT